MRSSIHLQLFRLLGRNRRRLLGPFLLGLGVSGLLLGQALTTSQIFVALFAPTTGDLTVGLVVLGLLLVTRPLLAVGRELLAVSAMTAVKVDLRRRVLRRLAGRGPIPLTRGRTGHVQSLLVDGVENMDAYYSRYLPQLGIVVVNTAVVVVLLARIDLPVAAAVGATALLVPLLPRLWDRILAERGSSHWTAYAELHADFVDSLQAMTTLKALGAVRRRQAELRRASEQLLAATMNQLRVSLVESGISAFALVLGPLVAIVVSLGRISAGALDPLSIFAITLLTFEMFRPFRELSGYWHAGYLGVFAGQQLLTTLAEPVLPDPDDPAPAPRPNTPGLAVQLSEVRYAYPGTDTAALDGVTLHVPAGTELALVGPSGSGKSTVAALLARFALPDTGEVRLGDRPTRDLTAYACVERVGLVPQSPVLFHGSLRHNLLDARPDATEDELLEAVHIAGLEGLAPDGRARAALDRSVGERGALLSGGQRQRVAIARALLQRTPVLVLDEATSALDVQAESALLARLRAARPGQTRLVIAHRLAVARAVPVIAVLDRGRVVEVGSHDRLMADDGLYAAMVRRQQADQSRPVHAVAAPGA